MDARTQLARAPRITRGPESTWKHTLASSSHGKSRNAPTWGEWDSITVHGPGYPPRANGCIRREFPAAGRGVLAARLVVRRVPRSRPRSRRGRVFQRKLQTAAQDGRTTNFRASDRYRPVPRKSPSNKIQYPGTSVFVPDITGEHEQP